VPRPRLIATDLDGTLLRSDGTLSQRTSSALRDCMAAGIEVVFVSGRPVRSVESLAAQVGGGLTAVCANGAVAHDFHSDLRTVLGEISPDQARRIIEELRAVLPDVGFAVETGTRSLREPAFRTGGVPGRDSDVVESWDAVWRQAERIVKVLARSASLSADGMVAAARAALTVPVEVSHSGGRGLVEFGPCGVTKATTLAWLCARRGVDAADVVAFGDMPNDLPMLRWAGTSYAVANAHPDVLAAGSPAHRLPGRGRRRPDSRRAGPVAAAGFPSLLHGEPGAAYDGDSAGGDESVERRGEEHVRQAEKADAETAGQPAEGAGDRRGAHEDG
jgi:hydroxymethylpyrimidine pyrophosphatase-like HAD family hydrolase